MLQFLLVTLVAVFLLILLIARFKMHPVLALFVVSLFSGVGYGYGFSTTLTNIASGFGSTLTGIGITIIFGATLAMGVRDTGAVKSMVNLCIRAFRGKNLELSTGLAGFIMSIPVFGDITGVLMVPIVSMLGKRSKRSMSTMAGFSAAGANLTHSLVPPTPGALAMVGLLGADLGIVILVSTVICLIAYLITWVLCRGWAAKEWIEPLPAFSGDVEPVDSDDYRDLLIQEDNLPNVALALLPILAPVILIAAASFASVYAPDSTLSAVLAVVGARDMAMFIGVLLMFGLAYLSKDTVIRNHTANTGTEVTRFSEVIFGSWLSEALNAAILPLMITAMGGAFSTIIKANPAIETLGNALASVNFPGVLFPFMLGAILMAAVGSRTTAGMTSAAICAPIMAQLGLTPLATFLLCGAGTMCFSHLNDSGFWVAISFYGFTVKQNLKYCTIIGTISGVVIFVMCAALSMFGII